MDSIRAQNLRVYWEKNDAIIDFYEDKLVIRSAEIKEPVEIRYDRVKSASVQLLMPSRKYSKQYAQFILDVVDLNMPFSFRLNDESRMIDYAIIKKHLKLDKYSVSERELVWLQSYLDVVVYILLAIALPLVFYISGAWEDIIHSIL